MKNNKNKNNIVVVLILIKIILTATIAFCLKITIDCLLSRATEKSNIKGCRYYIHPLLIK
jgi:hypothetical protein